MAKILRLHTSVTKQRRILMYKVIALFGESGAGKDRILNELLWDQPLVHAIVSYTTRPPREYELNGIDYCFIAEDEFLEKIDKGEFVEYTCFNGWYYGTRAEDLREDRINAGVFNIQGVSSLIADGRCKVFPFKISASDRTRLMRSLERDPTADCSEICRRFLADKEDFYHIPFNYTLLDNEKPQDLPFLMTQIEETVGLSEIK